MVERSDVDEEPQQKLEDDVPTDVEVQLTFGVVGPCVDPPIATGDEKTDAERDEDDGLDDALDDDDLDEGVVLASDAPELAPQAVDIMRAPDIGLGHRRRP